MRKRQFKWDKWDYDCSGTAYIIARDKCPNREDVPEWIVHADNLSLEVLDGNNPHCLSKDDIKEGWCKYQVRTDWENGDGEPRGGYYVENKAHTSVPMFQYWQGGTTYSKKSPGWFPVWIVRIGEWY